MKKGFVVLLLALALSLVGCSLDSYRLAILTQGGVEKTCVDGITYLQFPSGSTVQVDMNGRPVRCGALSTARPPLPAGSVIQEIRTQHGLTCTDRQTDGVRVKRKSTHPILPA